MKKVVSVVFIVIIIFVIGVATISVVNSQDSDFKGFIPVDLQISSLDEVLKGSKYLGEVEILRSLDKDEARKLKGMDEGWLNNHTYFEAYLSKDYFTNKAINKKIILEQFGTIEWQIEGQPIFEVGDKLLVFLTKSKETDEFYCPYQGGNGTLDLIEEAGVKYAYKRLGSFSELGSLNLKITEVEQKNLSKDKNNPIKFAQKFKMGNFVSSVVKEKERREHKE